MKTNRIATITRHSLRPVGTTAIKGLIAAIVCAGLPTSVASAQSLSDFDGFTPGSVNYQGTGGTTTSPGGYTVPDPYGSLWTVSDEWGFAGTFDQEVKDDGTGNMVWRLSNALTSSGFSNQPFTPSSILPAGESTAALFNDRGDNHTTPLSPADPRATAATAQFHGGLKFKSATGAPQTGLSITISPAPRQSNFRMSWLGISDNGADGLNLSFFETNSSGGFVSTPLATALSYSGWHQVDMYVTFVDGLNPDGSGNDVVHILLDGNLLYAGTTWETYYHLLKSPTSPSPIAVDSMTFRVAGTAAPATSGAGLYFDDVVVGNSAPPASVYPVKVYDGDDNLVDGYATIQGAIASATTLPGYTIEVASGTYVEDLVINKSVTLKSADGRDATFIKGVMPGDNGNIQVSAASVTIDGFTIEGNRKPVRLLQPTSGFRFLNNKLVTGNNSVPANGWVGIESNYNLLHEGMELDGNIFVANTTAQLVYINNTPDIKFTDNTIEGVMFPGGLTLGLGNFNGDQVIEGNTFDLVSTYALLEIESGSFDVLDILDANSWPQGGVAVGSGSTIYNTIQAAVNAAGPGATVQVAAGVYNEDVDVTKAGLTLQGAGAGQSTIVGPIGGNSMTVKISAANVTVDGFTITRAGNNPTDWNNPGLNSAGGVHIQTVGNATVTNNEITGNRTGIDINNSSGHTIRNNVIANNRTGMLLRNQTDNLTVVENSITGNWTVGILFLDGSSGTNSPVQAPPIACSPTTTSAATGMDRLWTVKRAVLCPRPARTARTSRTTGSARQHPG
jgi:parallel beta-helix repeat protein